MKKRVTKIIKTHSLTNKYIFIISALSELLHKCKSELCAFIDVVNNKCVRRPRRLTEIKTLISFKT